MPPNDPCLSCCVLCCGFGAEAYKESIDCFKSGLEGSVEPAGVDAVLEDLAEVAAGGPPKKSRPSSESEAFVGFGAAAALGGGALVPGVSVVLGLAGGSGTSPKRSIGCDFLGGGGTG